MSIGRRGVVGGMCGLGASGLCLEKFGVFWFG